MKTSYREMFDEVHASPRLKEEVMNMTRQERNQVVKRVSVSFIVAAALAVILAGTALAAVIGVPETLQEWFGSQWTEAAGGEIPEEQSAIFDSLVQPIGVSATDSVGVTVTLDSAMPGRNGLWLLLTVEGTSADDKNDEFYSFDFVNLTGPFVDAHQPEAPGIGQAASYSFHPDVNGLTKDGKLMLLLQYAFSNDVPFQEGGEMELHLENLCYEISVSDVTITGNLAAGEWVLPFTLQPTEEQPVLTAEGALVPPSDEENDPIAVEKIEVTSTGLNFEINSGFEERKGFHDEIFLFGPRVTNDVALQLSDGTEIKTPGLSGTWGGELEKSPWVVRADWTLPVDLTKAEAIRFGDVVVPLERPEP